MGFDDLYKHKKQRYNNNHGDYRGYRDDHDDDHGEHQQLLYFIEKLKGNKKLLLILAAVAVVALALVIAVLIMLVPVLTQMFAAVQKSGISGLVEGIKPWLDLIWSGTGK